jgi:hypothetical protein
MATGYMLDGRASIPDRGNIFISSAESRPAMMPTQPPVRRVLGDLFPGVRRPGRETDQSPPACAEAKTVGAIPLLPHMSSWRGA